ncbi:RNA polymerase sigma-70 factor (ECF subfamily) [Solirubrobacter pauli]|uniref:RNA polymerase sigma-70 factor (ECF subfamily) n=1 Tax=Solirubrobacter pauli TaxID=166793 RepID=A0A660L8F5_9ACTN|nr:RNA polymerase sigma factor [Solirubrobacter pauli]RKQ90220.1 RNA polymerase sigma-70 factor (ECF subfamily) [Solirubrobacter pauli]
MVTDDDELLRRAATGDDDAFALFYRRHRGLVVGYLRQRVSEPEHAFDLTAETFAAALVALRRYRPAEGAAAAWLLGIARNKLLESFRRGRVEARARTRLAMEPIAVDDEDLLAIEAQAVAGQASLERLLESLPQDQRAAIRARVLDEREYTDIARELESSPQVIRQRVSRGLRTLRAQLGERR